MKPFLLYKQYPVCCNFCRKTPDLLPKCYQNVKRQLCRNTDVPFAFKLYVHALGVNQQTNGCHSRVSPGKQPRPSTGGKIQSITPVHSAGYAAYSTAVFYRKRWKPTWKNAVSQWIRLWIWPSIVRCRYQPVWIRSYRWQTIPLPTRIKWTWIGMHYLGWPTKRKTRIMPNRQSVRYKRASPRLALFDFRRLLEPQPAANQANQPNTNLDYPALSESNRSTYCRHFSYITAFTTL